MDIQPVILYVEDEVRSRKVMQMITMDPGLRNVVIFEDSTDFLARLEALKPRPDLIFLDIHMKPYSGFEMLKLLRTSKPFDPVPVVAMTASVMNEEIYQLRVAGFSGCVAKPIDIEAFPEVLERLLRGEEIWRIVD